MSHVEPPDFYFHRSLLGVAVCDTCHRSWPCHLAAWGNPARCSRCNVCSGDVRWVAP